jgi:sigma-E factor negative regulatory protein RseA
MSRAENDPAQARGLLSALADGHADDGERELAFRAWREDGEARAAWHAYQLIGDVMRSDDLAAAPSGGRDFLEALRARLADEPVVLAPQDGARPPAAGGLARRVLRGRWQGPLAMAAGFLAVVGGIDILRPSFPGGAASPQALALARPAASATAPAAATAQARLDAEQLAPYLAAHRQSTMTGFLQMPGADLRNASLVQPAP